MTIGEEQAAREYLLSRVIDIFEEVTRSGPYTVSREWFTLDLTMPQVRVLFLLLQEGPLRMSGLASTLDVSMSSATGLVDRLVDKELVGRWPDPDDRRSVLCALTDDGREMALRLLAARRHRWEERLTPMSEDDLEKVREAMELVLAATRRATAELEQATAGTLGR